MDFSSTLICVTITDDYDADFQPEYNGVLE